MEIKPSSSYTPVPPVEARQIRRPAPAATDAGEFASTEALQSALNATPEVRPEAVARGRALVESSQYPPAATLQALARLFAFEFGGPKPPTA
jgi:hypothetical protein